MYFRFFKFHGRFLTAKTIRKRHHFCVFSFLQNSRAVSGGTNCPQTTSLLCMFVYSKFTGGFWRRKLPHLCVFSFLQNPRAVSGSANCPQNVSFFAFSLRIFKIPDRDLAVQTARKMHQKCIIFYVFAFLKPTVCSWRRKLVVSCINFRVAASWNSTGSTWWQMLPWARAAVCAVWDKQTHGRKTPPALAREARNFAHSAPDHRNALGGKSLSGNSSASRPQR